MATATDFAMDSKDKFMKDFNVLAIAGVGVTVVRTREPFRAIQTLKQMAFAEQGHAFASWDMVKGWATYSRSKPNDPPSVDGIAQPIPALAKIVGVTASDGFPMVGYYAMMWPHFPLKNSQLPPMLQILAEYAYLFPETGRRLILVAPADFEVPKELEDMLAVLDFEAPTVDELKEVYNMTVEGGVDVSRRPSFTDEELGYIVNAGRGMTVSEFESAVARALAEYKSLLPGLDADTMIRTVMRLKTEVVKRSDVLEVMEPVNLDNVGGLDELKRWTSQRRHCFEEEAAEYGVDRPKGIALIGPPGTGKSLFAGAVASELNLPLIRFDVSRLFKSLVGQTEGTTRAALKMVEALSPCVVMLDEIDKAFDMNSGGGDSGVGKRVLGAILTHMQESPHPVFWIMTANRTNGLPPELLRKGRLDEVWAVTVPVEEERDQIIRIHLSKRGWAPKDVKDLNLAVERSHGYVAAEIEAAVKEAITVHYANWRESEDGKPIGKLDGQAIADQLASMKPLSVAFAAEFSAMEEWANNNARPASSFKQAQVARSRPRPAATRTGNRVIDVSSMDG